ncbi:hypothetical protein [Nocardiopsis alborubida]|uniref:Uncharacterized protein n=1 Tax=Nocardiopsis alborubida TaxID=146802 RepID=A0A7X6RTF8_9ACTN|nr:hypothetical protein [Nocardiopsis alborubida]NKZ01679.1 hypothetical protein [Nocardiopsis alborubida]
MADIPSTGHVGEAGAHRFAMRGEGIGERSAAFVAFAREQTEAGRKVVALYPAWQSADAERAVNFARGAMRTDHIAGIGVDLSPLALSLVADQLAYLAPYLPPGMVAALCDELPRHLLAGAWLRSVSGLSTIPTSMRQHMGSYAPSVSFLAYCAPTHQVGRMRASDVSRTLPFRPVQPVQLLCSTPDPGITGIFDDHLPQAIQPVATRTLPAQPLGPLYWGTAKYVEFVALSAHPQALAYAASSIRAASCSWCGEPMSARTCPFCSATAARTPARQTAPRSGPRPSGGQGPPAAPDSSGRADAPLSGGATRPPGGPGTPGSPGRTAAPSPGSTAGPGPGQAPPPVEGGRVPGPPPPPSTDRPEGPPFAGRAPRPDTPRTYSR